MQTEKRLSRPSVIQDLFDDPQRFEMMQVLRILIRWQWRTGLSYERILKDVIRFGNDLSLAFPASEVASLRKGQGEGGTWIELVPACFGLSGVSGTLPLHVSECIAAARHSGHDEAPHALMNMLSQRLSILFFEAWGKYKLEHTLDVQGTDRQLPLLEALAGKPRATGSEQPGIPLDAIGYYASLLGTHPVAAGTISRVLSEYFGVPIELEPFVAFWDQIPALCRSTLGSGSPKCGHGAVLGRRLQRRDIAVRLNIGPLSMEDAERFLPRRPSVDALTTMASLFGLSNLKVAVRIKLQPSHIQRVKLTSNASAARRLGWDAFLVGRDGRVTRASVDYMLPLKRS